MAEKFKLRALSTFDGKEGFIRRGETFEAEGKNRRDQLVNDLKFAEAAGSGATVDAIAQTKPDDLTDEQRNRQLSGAGVVTDADTNTAGTTNTTSNKTAADETK